MTRLLKLVFLSAVLTLAQSAMAADPVAGAKTFKTNCAVCHATTASAQPGVGPTLAGVVGRVSGTQPAFIGRYSPPMKSASQPWTVANLKLYIADPSKAMPGNRMPFARLHDPAVVDNVIAYLTTLH